MPPPDNGLKGRREEARQALTGSEFQKRQAEKEKGLLKRRREAMLAMEGEERRKHRVERERKDYEKKAAVRAKTEAEHKEVEKIRQNQAEEEEKRRRSEEESVAAKTKRIKRVERAEAIIAELKKEPLKISPIRTLKTDMARAVKEEGISIAKIVLTEQAKYRLTGKGKELKPEKKKFLWPALAAATVVAAAAAGLWFFSQQQGETARRESAVESVVFTETSVEISTSGVADEEVRRQIELAAGQPLNRNAIRNIYFTDASGIVPLSRFRRILGLPIPDALSRAAEEEFMFGVHQQGRSNWRFLVLKTKFFELALAAMLGWEATMVEDIGPLLGITSPATVQRERSFKDKLVQNKDARLIKNSGGETLIFYAFLDNQTVVIARQEATYLELFRRFLIQR